MFTGCCAVSSVIFFSSERKGLPFRQSAWRLEITDFHAFPVNHEISVERPKGRFHADSNVTKSSYFPFRKYLNFAIVALILIGLIDLFLTAFAQEHTGRNLLEAVARAEQAVHESPTSAEAYLNLGFAYLAVASAQQAEAAFDEAVALAPQDPAGYYWLGEVHYQQGKYEACIDVFQRALEVWSDWSVAYLFVGMSYFERHNYEGAEVAFKKGLRLMLSSESLQDGIPPSTLGVGGQKMRTRMEALSLADVYRLLGLIESHRGHADKAIVYWQQAIEIGPPQAEVYFRLGTTSSLVLLSDLEDSVHMG